MPYTRSNAKLAASERIKRVKASFSYAKVRTRKLPTHVRDAIFQNCIFQLSAIFEDFISQLTANWFAKLQADSAVSATLPQITRAFYAGRAQEELFKRYFALGDENELASRIIGQSAALNLLNDQIPLPALDYHAKLIKDKKFPSPSNIDSLFRRLGLPKILQVTSRRLHTDCELRLRSFIDVRNSLAHESPPSLTDVDISRSFDHITQLIDAIDREFYLHIVRRSGRNFW